MHPDILVALLSRGCWLRAVNARHVGRQSHKGNDTHSHERNDTEGMCDCGVVVRAVHIGTWTCARALVNGGTTGRTSGTPIAIDLRGCQGGHDIRAYYLVIRSLATASAYYHTEQFVAIQILETQWLFCESNSPAGCEHQNPHGCHPHLPHVARPWPQQRGAVS